MKTFLKTLINHLIAFVMVGAFFLGIGFVTAAVTRTYLPLVGPTDVITSSGWNGIINDLNKYNEANGLMRYHDNGSIGLGVVNPAAQIDVLAPAGRDGIKVKGSTADSTKYAAYYLNSSGSPLLHVRNDGRVGIGVTNPQAALDISGGIKLGSLTSGTRGTCGVSTYGVMYFDTTEKRPYVCTNDSNKWKPLDSDYDKDGVTDAVDADDNNLNDATATAAQVLSGKTFYARGSKITGTISTTSMPGTPGTTMTAGWLPSNAITPDRPVCAEGGTGNCKAGSRKAGTNRGSIGTVTPTTSNQSKPVGFYNAFTVAGDADLIASNIRTGKNIFGVTGNIIQEDGLHGPNTECATTGAQSNCKVSSTKYVYPNTYGARTTNCTANNSGNCWINAGAKSSVDGDLIASNIRTGKNIFGITGNLVQEDGLHGPNTECGTSGYTNNCKVTSSKYVYGSSYGGRSANGGNVSGANGSKTFSIPNGWYSGKTATANDTDLVASNIKSGINIFGVTGTMSGPIVGTDSDGDSRKTVSYTTPASVINADCNDSDSNDWKLSEGQGCGACPCGSMPNHTGVPGYHFQWCKDCYGADATGNSWYPSGANGTNPRTCRLYAGTTTFSVRFSYCH